MYFLDAELLRHLFYTSLSDLMVQSRLFYNLLFDIIDIVITQSTYGAQGPNELFYSLENIPKCVPNDQFWHPDVLLGSIEEAKLDFRSKL